jgi:hypothetical protein
VWGAQLVAEFGRGAEALHQIGQDALGAAAARARVAHDDRATTVEATTIAATTTDTPVAAGSGTAGPLLPR